MSTTPQNLIIRAATPEDAEALVQHVHAMCVEAPQFLPMLPGEFEMTVEDERNLLTDVAALSNSAFLVAEIDGQVIGVLNYSGGKRSATRHSAMLGISIRLAWQGRGIGRALMQDAIRRAKASAVLRRLELKVYADNARAIHLYQSLGFEIEGTCRHTVIRNGQFVDDLIMAMIW